MTKVNRRVNGGLLLWCPTWLIKVLGYFGVMQSVGEVLVDIGLWDTDYDGGTIRWQLLPWRNNIKRLIRDEKERLLQQRLKFFRDLEKRLKDGPVLVVPEDSVPPIDPKKVN